MVPMRSSPAPEPAEAAAEPRPFTAPAQAFCPACLAPMVQGARGQYRCSRCHFTYCEGCEGGAAGDADA